VGANVRDLKIGQRVALMSGHAYAEYDIAAREGVVPLPEELDDDPFPSEPLARAVNIFERSDIHDGLPWQAYVIGDASQPDGAAQFHNSCDSAELHAVLAVLIVDSATRDSPNAPRTGQPSAARAVFA
jgi:hypothetical protein